MNTPIFEILDLKHTPVEVIHNGKKSTGFLDQQDGHVILWTSDGKIQKRDLPIRRTLQALVTHTPLII